jgi:hypothetical protein
MNTAYTVCMIIGIGLPFLSLVLGQIFDFFDGIFDFFSAFDFNLDFDFGFEIADLSLPLLPGSMQSLCAGVLIFGTTGKLIFNGENYLFANIIAGISGYTAALLMQMLISKLKKVENRPPKEEELHFREAKVTNTILSNSFGAISVKTDNGTLSYPAKAMETAEQIKQGTFVDIIKFEKNVAYVKPSKYAENFPEIFSK